MASSNKGPIAAHVHLGHGPSLYMLVGSGEREYLLCGTLRQGNERGPAELDALRGKIEQQFGYRASFSHFPIVGLCAECAA